MPQPEPEHLSQFLNFALSILDFASPIEVFCKENKMEVSKIVEETDSVK